MSSRRIYNLCGRIHLGPVHLNGGTPGARCVACGEQVTDAQRVQIPRTWDIVHGLLKKYKDKEAKR